MNRQITIAIDGHSSTGKSTLARQLAKALGYVYVDSGAMYRCVTLYALQQGFYTPLLQREMLIAALPKVHIHFVANAQTGAIHPMLNGQDVEDDIRGMNVSSKVSEVAAIPEVRKHLVALQQQMGHNKGVVMDGRDIGTVVFPDAELKIFMTARPEVRAQRRYAELTAKGTTVSLAEVLHNVTQRDDADTQRADSPLRMAADAHMLDNSNLTPQEQFAKALAWANEAIKG